VALSPSNLSRWRIFQGCISFKSIATGIPKRYVLADLARTGGMASAAAWLSNASSSNFFFGFGTYYKKQKLRPFFCQKKRAAPLSLFSSSKKKISFSAFYFPAYSNPIGHVRDIEKTTAKK
jgi:hypothetical protein